MASPSLSPSIEEVKKSLRKKSPSELMEEMNRLSSAADYDVDLLCAYLDVLEEKDPVMPTDYSPAADFEQFEAAHAELFSSPTQYQPATKATLPQRPHKKVGRLIFALAAVLALFIIVAGAINTGLIRWFFEWGEETFSLRPVSGVMELEVTTKSDFCSLQEALDSYQIEKSLIPTWIPTRFSIDSVSVIETDETPLISGKYLSDEGAILIRVAIGSAQKFNFEENASDPNEYVSYQANGITFIISSNLEKLRVTWTVDNCVCSLSGDITEDELYEVLDSIR